MKKLILVLAMIALVLPFAAADAQQQAPKAKTIDELAKMYDVSSCKECHQKVFEEWKASIHSRSLVGTGRTMATIRNAITDGMMKEWKKSGVKEVSDITVEHLMSCAKCHLPQLQDATDDVARQIAKAVLDGDEETLNKVSINCIVCHNMKAIVHKWVDGEPEKGAVYGKLEGPHPDKNYPAMKTSLIRQEAIFCGQCHGLGPNFELKNPTQCATLYGSYLHNYVPESGLEAQKCHDCHKNKKDRGHRFPAYRDPEMLKEAVTVEVQTMGYQLLYSAGDHIPIAGVVVTMVNNAGHRIPDGWPSPNRLVLDVTAKTKDGKEVFTDSKIYIPGSPAYGRGDKMVYGPFRKSGMLVDSSLAPGHVNAKEEKFSIPFPHDVVEKEGKKVREIKAKEMDVTIKLWYMPAGGDHKKGMVGKDQFLVYETTKTVSIK